MEVEVEQMEITIGGSVAEKILDTCIGTVSESTFILLFLCGISFLNKYLLWD